MQKEQSSDNRIEELVASYRQIIGDHLTAETMSRLNGNQLTLLAYSIFRSEMLQGGMVQLIHNGYGPFIFENPFAKAMRLWGLKDFSKFIYAARQLYEKYAERLTVDCTDEEFMALYEQFEDLDEIDDEFIEMESEVTSHLCSFVEAHSDMF